MTDSPSLQQDSEPLCSQCDHPVSWHHEGSCGANADRADYCECEYETEEVRERVSGAKVSEEMENLITAARQEANNNEQFLPRRLENSRLTDLRRAVASLETERERLTQENADLKRAGRDLFESNERYVASIREEHAAERDAMQKVVDAARRLSRDVRMQRRDLAEPFVMAVQDADVWALQDALAALPSGTTEKAGE